MLRRSLGLLFAIVNSVAPCPSGRDISPREAILTVAEGAGDAGIASFFPLRQRLKLEIDMVSRRER